MSLFFLSLVLALPAGLFSGGGVMLAGQGDGLLLAGVPETIDGNLVRRHHIPAGQVAAPLFGVVEAVDLAIGSDDQAGDAVGGKRFNQGRLDAMMHLSSHARMC